MKKHKSKLDAYLSDNRVFYALGIIGWILLIWRPPLGWELPKYAVF